MHELSLAQSVFDLVRQHVPDAHGGRVRNVVLRLGQMAGVMPGSLAFCFEALAAGSDFPHARLAIERAPMRGTCRACAGTFEVLELVFVCPGCGTGGIHLSGGQEIQLVQIELVDEAAEAS